MSPEETTHKTAAEIQPLSWRGYSNWTYSALDEKIASLSQTGSHWDNLPFFKRSLETLQALPQAEVEVLEKQLLDGIDHSVMLTPALAVIGQGSAAWMRGQVEVCFKTLLLFTRALMLETAQGKTIGDFLGSLAPDDAARFQSILETSRHNYEHFHRLPEYREAVQRYPLYLECGVDLMMGQKGPMLAEFQVRYLTPYPHLQTALEKTAIQNHRELCETLDIHPDNFEERRNALLEEAFRRYAERKNGDVKRIMIDAWTYQENAGANLKQTARSLGMVYSLFDDLDREAGLYGKLSSLVDGLFIFNQPPLYLLDPEETFFDAINQEGLETYEELGCRGLFRDYLAGRAFLTSPPGSDILNDKALYEFLPQLCRFFTGTEISLPVVRSREFWDTHNPAAANDHLIQWALTHREESVIAHRYLEGGMGIRVGKACSQEEWQSFLDTFVRPRPYLYVLRDYYPMEPDCSLRSLICGLTDMTGDPSPPLIETSRHFFGRVSATSPVSSDTARCFLAVEANNLQYDNWYSQQLNPTFS